MLTNYSSGSFPKAQIAAVCRIIVLHGPHHRLSLQAFQFPAIDFIEWSDHRELVLNMSIYQNIQLLQVSSPLLSVPIRPKFLCSFIAFFPTLTSTEMFVLSEHASHHSDSPKEYSQLRRQSLGIAWEEDIDVSFKASYVL